MCVESDEGRKRKEEKRDSEGGSPNRRGLSRAQPRRRPAPGGAPEGDSGPALVPAAHAH